MISSSNAWAEPIHLHEREPTSSTRELFSERSPERALTHRFQQTIPQPEHTQEVCECAAP